MGIEYGRPFIPPFSNLNEGTNANLQLPSALGKNFGLSLDFHTTIPSNNPSEYTPYYTGFIENLDSKMVYLGSQGFTALWTNMFVSHFQITKNDWDTMAQGYLDLFTNFYKNFVRKFLHYAPLIVDNLSETQIQALINAPTPLTPGDPSSDAIIKTRQVLKEVKEFLPNLNPIISGSTTTKYFQLLLDLKPYVTPSGNWQEWFLGGANGTPLPLYSSTQAISISDSVFENVIPPSTLSILQDTDNPELLDSQKAVLAMWEIFLIGSNLDLRVNSILYWAFDAMNTMLNTLYSTTTNQAERVTILTNAQKAATSAMSAVSFTSFNTTSDVAGQTAQQVENAWISIYRGQRNVLQAWSQAQSSAVNNTNSAQQQESSMVSQIISTIDSLIQGIFAQ